MAGPNPANFYTSPVVAVPADTPVAECVRLMRRRSIGAVIVLSDSGSEEPIGIFTERDLIRQVDLIQHGNQWNSPVRTIMTRPLVTLDIAEIANAADLMLKSGFRHLPVTIREENRLQLVGMISMRDLFREYARAGRPQPALPRQIDVAVLSGTNRLERILRQALSHYAGAKVVRFAFPEADKSTSLVGNLQKFGAVFMDIDHQPAKNWTQLLRDLLKSEDPPQVLIVYHPMLHAEKEVEAIRKIDAAAGMAAFAKPVDIGAIMRELQALLGE